MRDSSAGQGVRDRAPAHSHYNYNCHSGHPTFFGGCGHREGDPERHQKCVARCRSGSQRWLPKRNAALRGASCGSPSRSRPRRLARQRNNIATVLENIQRWIDRTKNFHRRCSPAMTGPKKAGRSPRPLAGSVRRRRIERGPKAKPAVYHVKLAIRTAAKVRL